MNDKKSLKQFGCQWLLPALLMTLFVGVAVYGEPVRLAEGGVAKQSVIVSAEASPEVRQSAEELADVLSRITGGEFKIEQGDAKRGITVGLFENHPEVKVPAADDPDSYALRERYLLRSHRDGLYVLGQTDLAVQNAVWDLAHRLGYRQFFPGQTWEVVPDSPDIDIDVDVVEQPDYVSRRIWYTYGLWPEHKEAYTQWCERNRMISGFSLNSGHAYGYIIRKHQQAFDEHPEYRALLDGQRTTNKEAKFCISNKDLRKLVANYAVGYFNDKPDADTVSVDPSDGANWCECQPCADIGTPSDLALLLANEVGEALDKHHPDKHVAMYAYNAHAAPPENVRAHPKVIINAATAFLKAHTIDEVIDGWRAAGVQKFGIRGYFSVIHWDKDMPGAARGASIEYVSSVIPRFYEKGALYYSAESSENWGPNGLSYYLASHMFWDIDAAQNLNALEQDFYEKAFGEARSPMEQFYNLIMVKEGERRPKVTPDLMGRMYRLLGEARGLTSDTAVLKRIDDLILYVRYVEIYQDFANTRGDERQANFEKMIKHVYRMKSTMLVHSKAIYRTYANRNKDIDEPDEVKWNKPEGENPWKSSEPWTREELDGFMKDGIANNELLDFEAVEFSDDLVPATQLKLPERPRLSDPVTTRGTVNVYTWFDKPGTLHMEVTGGLIEYYRDRGPATFDLTYVPADVDDNTTEELVAHGETEPDGVTRKIELTTPQSGLHRLTISDGVDRTQGIWLDDMPRVKKLDGSPLGPTGRRHGYFYVPKGTKHVAGLASMSPPNVFLIGPDGKEMFNFEKGPQHFKVEVGPGQDGKVWAIKNFAGTIEFMTVPSYIADLPSHLLLPREVVETDSGRTFKR